VDEIASTASGSFIFVLSIPTAQIEALSSGAEQSDAASRGSSMADRTLRSSATRSLAILPAPGAYCPDCAPAPRRRERRPNEE